MQRPHPATRQRTSPGVGPRAEGRRDWRERQPLPGRGREGHDRDRRGGPPPGRHPPSAGSGADRRPRDRSRGGRDRPIRHEMRGPVVPPRDAKDLAHRCSSIRGMYFSTAFFILSGSAVVGSRNTSRAFRPPWMIRYLFDLQWITTDSSESFASDVTVSADPTRTANMDPKVSTCTPRGKLPARYVPASETSIASWTPSFCSISRSRVSRPVVSTIGALRTGPHGPAAGLNLYDVNL